MTDYWFKPKTHGYGAGPSNWKGWLATFAFIFVAQVPAFALIVWPAMDRAGPQVWHFVVWAVLTIALVAGFILLCRVKTDGEWRWRWGE